MRAKGLEPPHLAILGPKPSASTNSATPARTLKGAAYSKDVAKGKQLGERLARQPSRSRIVVSGKEMIMPDTLPGQDPAPASPPPAQPPTMPPEAPDPGPNIDVPSPTSPGTEPPATPTGPVA